MKNPILIIAAFLCICFTTSAQDIKDSPSFDGFHKSISYQFKGFNYTRGFRYDMRLVRGKMNGIGFSVGLSDFNGTRTENNISTREKVVGIPIELNYVIGERKHGFITGLGAIPTYNKEEVIRRSFDGSDMELQGLDIVGGYVILGYRFAPLDNGFTFQLNCNPTFLKDGSYNARLGVSIGYAFK